MARKGYDFVAPARRVLIAVLVLVLLALFLFWRIDGPRAERMRAAVRCSAEYSGVRLTGECSTANAR